MTCLLGKVSMRHLKVRILFAKHKKNLHLSHSWVGFALSKSQESVHGEPGGWHSCWDCISRPAQALVWTGWELPSAIVTIKPDQYICLFIKDPTWFWSWKGLGMSTLTDLIVNIPVPLNSPEYISPGSGHLTYLSTSSTYHHLSAFSDLTEIPFFETGCETCSILFWAAHMGIV